MTVYTASKEDREKLKQPRGDTFQDQELIEQLKKREYSKVITVGDRVSQDIADSDIDADLSIVDGSIQREDVGKDHFEEINSERTFRTENPAGEITEEAWRTVRKASALTCETKIIVEGEEDLLALPVTLFAPEDAVIVYGHWKEGAVLMEASEENKDFIEQIVSSDRSEHLIVGGSWDIFHSGHRYIILSALDKGEKIDIGITSNEMIEEKLGQAPEDSFKERRQNIKDFLRSLSRFEDARLIEINDIYGNAVEEGESLLIAPESRNNAEKINTRREEQGREPINIEVVQKLKSVNGEPISSTYIRAGEIDQNGMEN
jgi:pantetheine-phosphate adenylyltransferase